MQLAGSVPDLRRVSQLLAASLAQAPDSAVAPQLQQRLQRCEAAIVVLSLPLTVAPGREAADMATLRNIQRFVEDCVGTLHEHEVGAAAAARGSRGARADLAALRRLPASAPLPHTHPPARHPGAGPAANAHHP